MLAPPDAQGWIRVRSAWSRDHAGTELGAAHDASGRRVFCFNDYSAVEYGPVRSVFRLSELCSAKRMFSGIAQFVREHWHNIQVSKVKAHLAVDEAPDECDRCLRQGNESAHISSKAAASLQPSPLPEELEGLDKSVAVARAAGRLGAKLLSLWPRLSMGKDVELNKEAPVKEQVPPPTPHQWHWVGSYWQWATCLRGRRGRPSRCRRERGRGMYWPIAYLPHKG